MMAGATIRNSLCLIIEVVTTGGHGVVNIHNLNLIHQTVLVLKNIGKVKMAG